MAKGNQTHLSQGEGGGGKTRSTGSHTAQGTAGGAGKRGPSGDKFDQMTKGTRSSGSHLDQQPSMKTKNTKASTTNREGGDHTHGQGPSGSKNSQNPNFG